jgi:alkanesulfonate monooxygenase SsuD/methylene tetrahydromethanopterin reductase-like flavin-dependent oxidoreductase (luciferase family)
MTNVKVGLLPLSVLADGPGATADRLARMADAGLDHVCCGDHVSFGPGGAGFDGLIQATGLALLHPTLPVHTAIYQLPLRHPMLVARQLVDLDRLAPGRLVFGVGIGGEDRHEVESCGIDPASRGRRMDESLTVLRQLLTGEPTTFHGKHVDLTDAIVAPAPGALIPIIVGGRSDVAVRRAGRLGDGWIAIWVSARRFGEATALANATAAEAGRTDWQGRHVLQVWCGVSPSKEDARSQLAPAMEAFYGLPFTAFERYCPYGTAEEVAEFLRPYVDAGCTEFNLITQAEDDVAATAAVKQALTG